MGPLSACGPVWTGHGGWHPRQTRVPSSHHHRRARSFPTRGPVLLPAPPPRGQDVRTCAAGAEDALVPADQLHAVSTGVSVKSVRRAAPAPRKQGRLQRDQGQQAHRDLPLVRLIVWFGGSCPLLSLWLLLLIRHCLSDPTRGLNNCVGRMFWAKSWCVL